MTTYEWAKEQRKDLLEKFTLGELESPVVRATVKMRLETIDYQLIGIL